MTLSETQIDRIFRLDDSNQVMVQNGQVSINYGHRDLPLEEVAAAVRKVAAVDWRPPAAADVESPHMDDLRLHLASSPKTSLKLLTLVDGCRVQVLKTLNLRVPEGLSRYIRLWIWERFWELDMQEHLLDEEGGYTDELRKTQGLLPTFILELSTIFNTFSYPLSYPDWRKLTAELNRKMPQLLEEMSPAVQRVFRRRIDRKKEWRGRSSLLMDVHDETWVKPKVSVRKKRKRVV